MKSSRSRKTNSKLFCLAQKLPRKGKIWTLDEATKKASPKNVKPM
jgi:hypothetical protein